MSRFPAERVRLSQWQREITEKLKAGGPIAISAEAARFLVADLKKAEDRLAEAEERQADPARLTPALELGHLVDCAVNTHTLKDVCTCGGDHYTVGEGEDTALNASPKQPNPCPRCGTFRWSDPRPCWNCARLDASRSSRMTKGTDACDPAPIAPPSPGDDA